MDLCVTLLALLSMASLIPGTQQESLHVKANVSVSMKITQPGANKTTLLEMLLPKKLIEALSDELNEPAEGQGEGISEVALSEASLAQLENMEKEATQRVKWIRKRIKKVREQQVEDSIQLDCGATIPLLEASATPRAWPGGVVYYTLSPAIPPTGLHLELVKRMMAQIEDEVNGGGDTCIQFKEGFGMEDISAVTLLNAPIDSSLGYNEILMIGSFASSEPRVIIQQLLRVLGLPYEHQRPDRDDYVDVSHDNIESCKESRFKVFSKFDEKSMNNPYSFDSIMHFKPYDYSKTGNEPVLRIKDNRNVGQSMGNTHMTPGDVLKVRQLYGCPSRSGRPSVPILRCSFEKKNAPCVRPMKIFEGLSVPSRGGGTATEKERTSVGEHAPRVNLDFIRPRPRPRPSSRTDSRSGSQDDEDKKSKNESSSSSSEIPKSDAGNQTGEPGVSKREDTAQPNSSSSDNNSTAETNTSLATGEKQKSPPSHSDSIPSTDEGKDNGRDGEEGDNDDNEENDEDPNKTAPVDGVNENEDDPQDESDDDDTAEDEDAPEEDGEEDGGEDGEEEASHFALAEYPSDVGPRSGTTNGADNYLLASVQDEDDNDEFQFVTDLIKERGTFCLEFSVYEGDPFGLYLSVLDATNKTMEPQKMYDMATHAYRWRHMSMQFETSSDYKIKFEVVADNIGEMGIDDVMLYRGSCPAPDEEEDC